MRFWRAILPNMTISLVLASATVVILNFYNPMMGFMNGWPFLALISATLLCSLATAIVLYSLWRRRRPKRRVTEETSLDEEPRIE